MRCGCISLGAVSCDECKRNIAYPERYLVINEGGKVTRLCLDCCKDKEMVSYTEDNGAKTVTFFPQKS